MNIQCAEQNFEFWEGTHQIKRVWPPPGTNHSTRLKAALPSDPPFTVYLPTNEKLYLVWVYSSNCCSEEYTLCENCLFRPKREEYIMPCFFVVFFLAHFKENVCHPFPFCLFFLLLALLFVQNVSLSWWMYCAVTTYLPALVWICCFYVWGEKGTEGQKPWFKKKEKD